MVECLLELYISLEVARDVYHINDTFVNFKRSEASPSRKFYNVAEDE